MTPSLASSAPPADTPPAPVSASGSALDGPMPTPPAANSMSSDRYSLTRAANTWNDKMAAPLAWPLVQRSAALAGHRNIGAVGWLGGRGAVSGG